MQDHAISKSDLQLFMMVLTLHGYINGEQSYDMNGEQSYNMNGEQSYNIAVFRRQCHVTAVYIG